MAGLLWISDREPGVRSLFRELLPEAEILAPDELEARLQLGQRPDGLVIDGTQLLELPARERRSLLALPRVLVCTGRLLASLPLNLVSSPGVVVLAKPFCIEDLEVAIEWLREGPRAGAPASAPLAAIVQRRRPRRPRGGGAAH
ncbi:MAG TPA: hypothetical protein VMP86_07535 [Candidatus Binatia bacterium]|nr:hypothetical protein [Candidatus Binatia bacterium]